MTEGVNMSQSIRSLGQAARENPGLGCVSHGDAHSGNIFIDDELAGRGSIYVTFIDLESMNRAIDAQGRATGSAAEDMANFCHKLGQHGRSLGLSPSEVDMISTDAMKAYMRPR
jgi:Ser/Thr protein kinase RdoA (MazF antagonist)